MKRTPPLHMTFHGVRGSRPVHLPDFLQTGGNTTCVGFDSGENFHLLIDGGTGLAKFGYKLGDSPNRKRFHILITHTHWDHVICFMSFMPLFDPDVHITFYAPNTTSACFEDLYHGLFKHGHLPMPQGLPKAKVNFVEIAPRQPFLIEGHIRVEGFQLNHQGITLGYKVSSGESSAVVITDTAPMVKGNYLGEGMIATAEAMGHEAFEQKFHRELTDFLTGVHTVVFDTHFNDHNLKPDWGHSTPGIALDYCKKAGVKRLFMFHHAPEDNDLMVFEKLQTIHNDGLVAGVEVANAVEEDEWPLKSA